MADQQPVVNTALIARIDAATKRADGGDRNALAVIEQVFDAVPSVWDAYGNLAEAAENAVIDLWAENSALTSAGLRRRLAAMRVELAGPEPSPLERLLKERVVACWLQSYHADLAYARAVKDLPADAVESYQRRQDRAARQYLKALRTLAEVRRLLVSAVPVNIAKRQVNIAAAEGPTIKEPRRDRRPPDRPRKVAPAGDEPGAPNDLA